MDKKPISKDIYEKLRYCLRMKHVSTCPQVKKIKTRISLHPKHQHTYRPYLYNAYIYGHGVFFLVFFKSH